MTVIEKLRALEAAATPGKWIIHPRDSKFYPDDATWEALPVSAFDFDTLLTSGDDFLGANVVGTEEPGRSAFTVPDAALIAAARNALHALIEVAEAAAIMRHYCLGSDASTQNMLLRYDAAIARLEETKL